MAKRRPQNHRACLCFPLLSPTWITNAQQCIHATKYARMYVYICVHTCMHIHRLPVEATSNPAKEPSKPERVQLSVGHGPVRVRARVIPCGASYDNLADNRSIAHGAYATVAFQVRLHQVHLQVRLLQLFDVALGARGGGVDSRHQERENHLDEHPHRRGRACLGCCQNVHSQMLKDIPVQLNLVQVTAVPPDVLANDAMAISDVCIAALHLSIPRACENAS